MTSVKVAVRVRPFNDREITKGSKCCIEMDGNSTTITNPTNGKTKTFIFDHSYWSHDCYIKDDSGKLVRYGSTSNYISQQDVFEDLGEDVLENAFKGYHTCLFAYGQTGSGKSYSIFGNDQDFGIVPKICKELFSRAEEVDEEEEKDESILAKEDTYSAAERK